MNIVKHYFKSYKGTISLMAVLYIISTITNLALPTIMSFIVNDGVNNKDLNLVAIYSIIMFAVAIIGLLSIVWAIKLSSNLTCNISRDMRRDIFKKVNTFSVDQYDSLGTGALLTRSTEDITQFQWVMGMMLRIIITVPLLLIGGTALAFTKDIVLSLILFASAPIIALMVYIIGKVVAPLWEKSDKYIDIQNNIMRERLNGMRVIRSFNMEESEHNKIVKATHTMANYIIKSNSTMGLLNPVSLLLLNISVVLIAYIGSTRAGLSGIMAGDVIAIIQYAFLVANGIIVFSFGLVYLPRIKVTINRINEVYIKPQNEMVSNEEFKFSDTLEVSNVSFCYPDSKENSLTNISFQLKNGKSLGIIGGTGSGKSTLVQLLLSYYDATEGKVSLDNVGYNSLTKGQIRNSISCVLQKSTIFSGTVKENILMGNKNATDEQIIDALKMAQIYDFVAATKEGLEYKIEQNGKNLSGGQKQRLAIARALIHDGSLYIFDDSFSALDFLTESKLRKNLNRKLKDKFQIIVSQRVSSVMLCDEILVLDKGENIGYGVHKDLLKNCNIYREIYSSQIGGDLD